MTSAERDVCTVMAAMLNAQCALGGLGLLITLWVATVVTAASLLSLEIQPGVQPLAAVVAATALLLGAIERYVAFRIRLDERLFNALATGQLDSVTRMDEALIQLGLVSKNRADRTLQQRLNGAAGLCHKHRGIVIVQWLAALAFVVMQAL